MQFFVVRQRWLNRYGQYTNWCPIFEPVNYNYMMSLEQAMVVVSLLKTKGRIYDDHQYEYFILPPPS